MTDKNIRETIVQMGQKSNNPELHIRFNKDEYDKIALFAYYANKSKNEIVRIAVQKLKDIKPIPGREIKI